MSSSYKVLKYIGLDYYFRLGFVSFCDEDGVRDALVKDSTSFHPDNSDRVDQTNDTPLVFVFVGGMDQVSPPFLVSVLCYSERINHW